MPREGCDRNGAGVQLVAAKEDKTNKGTKSKSGNKTKQKQTTKQKNETKNRTKQNHTQKNGIKVEANRGKNKG